MAAGDLIREARARGASVYLKGDQAAVRGILPAELLAEMRACKIEIVVELRAESERAKAEDAAARAGWPLGSWVFWDFSALPKTLL